MKNFSAITSMIHERRLTSPRLVCNLNAEIEVAGHQSHCAIKDISTEGLCLVVDSVLNLTPYIRIRVVAPEIGAVSGAVRWAAGSRVGVEFDHMSKMSKRLREFVALLESQEHHQM